MWVSEDIDLLISDFGARQRSVNVQIQCSATFTPPSPKSVHGIHLAEGWMVPRAALEVVQDKDGLSLPTVLRFFGP